MYALINREDETAVSIGTIISVHRTLSAAVRANRLHRQVKAGSGQNSWTTIVELTCRPQGQHIGNAEWRLITNA